ncbi:MAG: complex I subunit 5 family protein [bacterium]
MWETSLPIWIVLVPILTAFISIFITNENMRKFAVIGGTVLDFVLILLMAKPVLSGRGIEVGINWMERFNLGFRVDPAGYLMALVVGFVWLLTVIYGESYLKKEGKAARYDFFSLITMAMNLGVMLAGDFLTLFIFFEGLVIFPYSMIAHRGDGKSVRGANFYLYVGVITGLVLLCGILLLNYFTGSLDIVSQGEKLSAIPSQAKYLIAFLMIFGFGGKAALFGEHVWVSKMYPNTLSLTACLSSGAMIKAGAYGIFRVVNLIYSGFNSNLFTQENIGYAVIMVGIVTMFLGVLNALISSDSQEMLGYHSVSQMGYIIMGIGCAAYMGKDGAMGLTGALYHMVNHSLFKASLFLGVGAVYYTTGEQNMYKLGGLFKKMPVSAICLLIAVLGISGIPGFNGFVSKTLLHHSIVEAYEHSAHYFGKPDNLLRFAEIIFILTAAGTFASNIKLFILVFLGKEKEVCKKAKEVPVLMRISLISFSVVIILIGLFPTWLLEHIIGPGLGVFGYDPSFHVPHIYNVHNLLPSAVAVFLGSMCFILGMRFGWFHVHVPELLTVEYYYRKIFNGFKYFCVKPCLVFSIWVKEFISILMVYIWVPGSHEGKGYDKNIKKRPGIWEMFDRVDTNYDNVFNGIVQKQGGLWRIFDKTDVTYDTILDRVISAIIGVEEIPISVIEEEEVLERLPGEGLVAGYYKFCNANKSVDLNVIDGFVNYLGNATIGLGSSLRKLQTGKVPNYAYGFVVGAIVLMLMFLVK